jgi:hypothetical protein
LLDVMWGPVLSFACPDDVHADTASRTTYLRRR